MSGAVTLEQMESAARVCASDMWTLRGVWDAYGLWFNSISLPKQYAGYDGWEERQRRDVARARWHCYVIQERKKIGKSN